jgi:hypothetical protein
MYQPPISTAPFLMIPFSAHNPERRIRRVNSS